MIKTPLSTVIGGAFWTPGATVIGGGALNFEKLVAKLFANNEQGFFYDPNDLSTMFRDAAGTVPVTDVGQPVGRILDKSQGLVLGAEKIINGDFANGTAGWVSGTNWTATLGTSTDALTITTNSEKGYGCAIQAVPLVAGKTYKITGKYRSSQGGNAAIGLGNSTGSVTRILISSTTSVEFVEFSVIFTYTNGSLILYNNTVENGVVSEFKNVSIKEVLGNHAFQTASASRPILRKNAVTGAYYLEFDGSDDFFVTNSIDFTATDKISLFAGVSKLVDTAQIIAELSTRANANPGSFSLISGNDAGGIGYVSLSRGSSSVSVEQTARSFTYSGADTAVLSVKHDISGDLSSIRRNGVVGIDGTGDKGGGNFGNYPLYIGRRGGTSTPFNGHLYSLIGTGRLATASEITSIEKELAKRIGVTLSV